MSSKEEEVLMVSSFKIVRGLAKRRQIKSKTLTLKMEIQSWLIKLSMVLAEKSNSQ